MSAPASVPVWVVRGGDNNELASQVPKKGVVAIGWGAVGDLKALPTRERIQAELERSEPGSGTANSVGQLFRFANAIAVGDYILTPEGLTKTVHVSRCDGDYRFDPTVFGETYPHVRPVTFVRSIKRDAFPVTVLNTLGSLLTVFRADNALPTLENGQQLPSKRTHENFDNGGFWVDVIEAQAKGQILERFAEIDHHAFQYFVAGLLEALGYKARVGQKGKDGGVDVLAYPDVFGLASPRIKVQVKNQKTTAGLPDVGYLKGILSSDERGLFICTGGFSNDAKNATFVRDGVVTLVDGRQLLDLVLEHYDRMPQTAKNLLPLRRVYVPESTLAD